MNILAIDTTGTYASAAILRDGKVALEFSIDAGRTHSETLMPLIDRALSTMEMVPHDMDLFVSVAGPGSFTGVRIGVLTVKALAHAVNKPCAGVSTLKTLSAGCGGFEGTVVPMLDARRDQVYAAAFSGAGARILNDDALSVTEFLGRLPLEGMLYFTGDGSLKHKEEIIARFSDRAAIAPPHLAYPRASAAASLALSDQKTWTDAHHLAPIYLRAPQAERERAEKHAER